MTSLFLRFRFWIDRFLSVLNKRKATHGKEMKMAVGICCLSTTAACGIQFTVVVKALCYKPEGRGFDAG
jgi:hypothetical protein